MEAVYVGSTFSLHEEVGWIMVVICKSHVALGHLLHAGRPVLVSPCPTATAAGESCPECFMRKSKLDFLFPLSS